MREESRPRSHRKAGQHISLRPRQWNLVGELASVCQIWVIQINPTELSTGRSPKVMIWSLSYCQQARFSYHQRSYKGQGHSIIQIYIFTGLDWTVVEKFTLFLFWGFIKGQTAKIQASWGLVKNSWQRSLVRGSGWWTMLNQLDSTLWNWSEARWRYSICTGLSDILRCSCQVKNYR